MELADLTGKFIINSSTLLLSSIYNYHAEEIILSPSQKKDITGDHRFLRTDYKNSSIRDLRLYGPVEVIINSTGVVRLPASSPPSSLYSYIPISIPIGSDITLNLSNQRASAEFVINGNAVKITTGKEIRFRGMTSDSPDVKSIVVIMKNPEIKVTGNASLKELYSTDRKDPTKIWSNGETVDVNGTARYVDRSR